MSKKNVKKEYVNRYNKKYYNRSDIIVPDNEYVPEVYTERVFDNKTETYKYVQKTVNLKLDWENEIELMQQINIDKLIKRSV